MEEIGTENMSGLIEMFIGELGNHIDEIESALGEHNYSLIASKGHSLKGSSVSFGAYGLSRTAGDIEEFANKQDIEGVKKSIKSLVSIRKDIESNLLNALEALSF